MRHETWRDVAAIWWAGERGLWSGEVVNEADLSREDWDDEEVRLTEGAKRKLVFTGGFGSVDCFQPMETKILCGEWVDDAQEYADPCLRLNNILTPLRSMRVPESSLPTPLEYGALEICGSLRSEFILFSKYMAHNHELSSCHIVSTNNSSTDIDLAPWVPKDEHTIEIIGNICVIGDSSMDHPLWSEGDDEEYIQVYEVVANGDPELDLPPQTDKKVGIEMVVGTTHTLVRRIVLKVVFYCFNETMSHIALTAPQSCISCGLRMQKS
ncbi:hypothetical protein HDV00_010118 [Rhizophlyctis rosea]|nr:hypothetical protein HDV00_010118 [Rhizophlyctis rosea]